MLWGSFGFYLISHCVYAFIKWEEPRVRVEDKINEDKDEDDLSDKEDQARHKRGHQRAI